MTLDVLPNPSVVVPGGHPVTVVFCISGECQEWSNALPVETKAKIEKDNSVPLSFMEEHAMQSFDTMIGFNTLYIAHLHIC